MSIVREADQIFRLVTMSDYGIDGEVEFKDNDGKSSGRKIYVQLNSWNYYVRSRRDDGSEVFEVKHQRHLYYWSSQLVDVYLIIRQSDDTLVGSNTGGETIRWMNITNHLKNRQDTTSRQIIFEGERIDVRSIRLMREGIFAVQRAKSERSQGIERQE